MKCRERDLEIHIRGHFSLAVYVRKRGWWSHRSLAEWCLSIR